MCVLRDTYLVDDHAHRESGEGPQKSLPVKQHEERHVAGSFVTTHFWCRTCKQKTPANLTAACDCGMIMCINCWEEWSATCPICDAKIN
jgi:hypothetical protein